MSQLYEVTNSVTIRKLLDLVKEANIGLPAFQRSFVWPVDKSRSLLLSILRGYPAGALLTMKTDGSSENSLFAVRAIESAPPLANGVDSVVLDGQQRLTSIYQLINGSGEHVHFLNVPKFLEALSADGVNEENFEDVVISLRRSNKQQAKRIAALASISTQSSEMIMPLARLQGGGAGVSNWFHEIRYELQNAVDVESWENARDLVAEEFADAVLNYDFPMVALKKDVPAEAVASVFDNLNSSGMTLNMFDIMVARAFTPGQPTLQDRWQDACDDTPGYIGDYAISPIYALHVIALLVGHRSGQNKSSPVLRRILSN